MLDIRTLFFLLVLATLMAGMAVLFMQVPEPARRRNATMWAVANFVIAAGLLLVGLRSHIPLWPSVVLGNALVLTGFSLLYSAYTALMLRPQRLYLPVLVLIGSGLLLHVMVTHHIGQGAERIAAVSLVTAVLALLMLRTAYIGQDFYTQAPARMMQMFYGITLLASLARAVDSLFFPGGAQQLFAATPVQILSFLGYFFALAGAGIAYVLTLAALAYRDLAVIANNDMLTGVRNRHNFMLMAERDLALAQRMWRPLAVMMLDLDHFKQINDRHGHLAGDEVLRRFGDVLRASLRNVDLVGRYGGEEFCIVMNDSTPEAARHTAERIRQEFSTLKIIYDGKPLAVSVSIGIAGMSPGEHVDMQELLRRADSALYQAKAGGRNRVHQLPG